MIKMEGKPVAKTIRQRVRGEVERARQSGMGVPGLAVVLVGNDPASEIYVGLKHKAALAMGMRSMEQRLGSESRTEEVLDVVRELNQDPGVHGILVQFPLPAAVDRQRVLDEINPAKDVDGLTRISQGALAQNLPGLRPCTALGVLDMLKHYDIPLAKARAVVIGRSALVGLPAALMLMQEQATVTIVHSRTVRPDEIAREADILVVAAGQPELVRGDWIKPGAAVVDVGIHRTPQGLIGDVKADEADHAGALSPVPGGVGPMTIAELMHNTLSAFLQQAGR